MVLLSAIAIAFILVTICVLLHYEILRLTSRSVPDLPIATRSRVLAVIAGVFTAHLMEICLFAVAYALLHHIPQFGSIGGQFSGSGLDFFYFSITSYTTLGVGDLFPHGMLRLLAGIEALTGFVLIGWSASFTYLAMEKFWGQHGRTPRSRASGLQRPQDWPSGPSDNNGGKPDR